MNRQTTFPSAATEGSPLLTAFRAISNSDVYTMAPREAVVRGYSYYQEQRLHHYTWGKDRATLTAQVQGTRMYNVLFFLDDGFLSASCDCPAWSPDRLCKHVLCACFTTKNLLSPDAFRLPDWQQTRVPVLRAELFGSVAEQSDQLAEGAVLTSGRSKSVRQGYEIVIDARQAYPRLVIRRNGKPLGGGWAQPLPSELAPLCNPSWFSSGFGEDPLLTYLRRHDRAYPIILESEHAAIPLQWEPSIKCQSKTAIDLAGHQVKIRAVCLADGVELEQIVRFRTFVVDPRGGRLLLADDERGWASYGALRQRFNEVALVFEPDNAFDEKLRAVTLPDGAGYGRWAGMNREMAFTLALEVFQSVQIDLIEKQAERTLRDLIFTIDGKPSPVERSHDRDDAASYAVILMPPPAAGANSAGSWTLKAECRRDDEQVAPSASTFAFIWTLEHGLNGSALLRAQKRKAVLYDTFFKLISVRETKARNQRIQSALAPQGWSRVVTNDAARWLRHVHAAFARADLRLHCRQGRWELQPVNKAQEALLYQIPFEVFGPAVFRGMRRFDEMRIDAGLLFPRLPDLMERLSAAGIDLLYEDTPLKPARWDCAIHVGRGERDGTGIDWFELRPEIRCDGAVLEKADWQAALQQGGFVKTNRGLRVLDRETLDQLRAIMGLTGEAPANRDAVPIVRVPRLQILDWLALREQGITVSLPAEDEAVLARLMGFTRIAAPPLPKSLHATIRPYQRDGYAWLAFLYEHRFGACLADDMGLGKTLQAICLLAAIHEGRLNASDGVKGPHLVVVPTSLLFNWEQELARFAPDLRVHIYNGSNRTLEAGDGDVVVTTYGLVRRDIETLGRIAFHVIVFDEAQAVKNIQADTTGAVRRLNGRFKIALTGTPLENHLGEYFSVIDLCVPGLLGEYEHFKGSFKSAQSGALDRLLRRTRPFVLRRTKAQILHELPPKVESEVFLNLTERQKALYQQTVAQVRSTIEEAYRTKTSGQAQVIALTAILKLRQVCLSPSLLTHRTDEPSPKLSFLVERLQVLLEEGHSALVFSQFTSFLDLVEDACVRHALPRHRLDGSTRATARKARVGAFQLGEQPSVFLLSLKAGGQGLNLTRATYVFHLDPWWNPAVENQASDRAHRIGQRQPVSIVRILMRHSIEEKMMALKQRKLDLYNAVMAGAVRSARQGVLTRADFEFLLSPSAR